MKRRPIFFLLSFIALVAIGIYFLRSTNVIPPSGDETGTTNESEEVDSGEYSVETETIDREAFDGAVVIKTSFPVVRGLSGESRSKINNKIRGFVEEQISLMLKQAEAMDIENINFFESGNHQFTLDVESKTFEDEVSGMLSVELISYYYTGGAHPGTSFKTFNFDLSTGNEVILSDIFMDNSDYLERLSGLSRSKLVNQLGEDATPSFIEAGTLPESKNFERLLLLKEGLEIIFSEYQVAPYAAGPQRVTIEWSFLEDIIHPSFKTRLDF